MKLLKRGVLCHPAGEENRLGQAVVSCVCLPTLTLAPRPRLPCVDKIKSTYLSWHSKFSMDPGPPLGS